MKKAMRWLDEQSVEYTFHDYRKDGIDKAMLENLETMAGWETLLNKRGTTWRKLDDAVKTSVDRDSALALMLEQPAMIKRPVLIKGKTCIVGYDTAAYEKL